MKLRSGVKLLDVRDRKKGKFGSTKRSLCESFMTKSSSGRRSVRSWWKECAFFFNKLQESVQNLARSFTIHWIGLASMIKIALASVHVDFNEQNDSLILIRDYLIYIVNLGS